MSHVARFESLLTADEFLAKDQSLFGDAYRYELIDGFIVAQAAPSPQHGRVLSGLVAALATRLRGNAHGCVPETGSGAVPARTQRNTARIPDVLIRCGQHPRVTFEIVSPSELRDMKGRNRKRRDVQDIEGVVEIVEIYQRQMAAQAYRKAGDGTWSFESVDGEDGVIAIKSMDLSIPLAEIYEFAMFAEDGQGAE